MANYYHEQWLKARLTEGASQRVQEDTLKFARIMEGLGTGLLDSLMTLVAFTPILWGLSKQINVQIFYSKRMVFMEYTRIFIYTCLYLVSGAT